MCHGTQEPLDTTWGTMWPTDPQAHGVHGARGVHGVHGAHGAHGVHGVHGVHGFHGQRAAGRRPLASGWPLTSTARLWVAAPLPTQALL